MITFLLIVFSTALLLGMYITLWRNNRVYNYRMNVLLPLVSQASTRDIKLGRYNNGWRYEVFSSISYQEMVWKFWRPLNSFYPDKSFLENAEEPDDV